MAAPYFPMLKAFYSIPQHKQPSTGLPRGAGRSSHSSESLTSSRSLDGHCQQARQGAGNGWATVGSAWGTRGNRSTFTAIAIHCVQTGGIQLHMQLSNKPLLENQSKQWSSMHGGTAGFQQQRAVCLHCFVPR